MTDAPLPLPGKEDAGCHGTWHVTDWAGKSIKIQGTFLGAGSTFRPFHKGHPAGEPAMRSQHCSACRWSEIGLFREDLADGAMYVLVNRGISLVPGETERTSTANMTPETLEELVAVFRELGHGAKFLDTIAMSMLAQAIEHDEALRDVAAARR